MNRSDIERVMENYPKLNSFGFGLFDHGRGKTPDEKQAALKEGQDELLLSEERCTAICKWLEDIGKIKSINRRHNSYGLKHRAEDDVGYVTNGQFICAAIHMGFQCQVEDANASFNMSEKDLKQKIKQTHECKDQLRNSK